MLLACDSFDHYATADLLQKWTSKSEAQNGTVTIGAFGRNSTNGFRSSKTSSVVGPNVAAQAFRTIPNSATIILGFAFKVTTAPNLTPNGTTDWQICTFRDGSTIQITLQLEFSTNRLIITRNGTVLATGTTGLSVGTYYYIEVKLTVNDTTGVCNVKINGAAEISFSGDTKNTANAYCNSISLGSFFTVSGAQNPIFTFDYDDMYICDGSGSYNNDYLGDVRVQALLPSGAGATTQWTPSAGSNYDAVNETTPNGDTDYVSDGTPGDRDTYVYGDLSLTTGHVKAVVYQGSVRKDDAGTRTLRGAARIGGTDYDTGVDYAVGSTYSMMQQVQELSPATSGIWSITEVNAAEFGLKVQA